MQKLFCLITLGVLIGCASPYKAIQTRPPLSTKDTLILAQRCGSVFPIDTVYRRGDIIYITPDSLTYWQIKADSFRNAEPSVREISLTKYKDTCTQAADDGFETGFDLGHQIGLVDGKMSVKPVHDLRVDTIIKIDTREVAASRTTIELQAKDVEKWRGKSESKSTLIMWLLIALIASIGLHLLRGKFNIPIISNLLNKK